MNFKLLMVLMAFMPGCYVFDSHLPRPKAVYGKASEHTVAITVGMGFRHPGIHHMPCGITVRELLKTVPMLPGPECGAEAGMWGLKVIQMKNGRPTGFISDHAPTEKQLDTVLENDTKIVVVKYNA